MLETLTIRFVLPRFLEILMFHRLVSVTSRFLPLRPVLCEFSLYIKEPSPISLYASEVCTHSR
jgi:hypothetical protein